MGINIMGSAAVFAAVLSTLLSGSFTVTMASSDTSSGNPWDLFSCTRRLDGVYPMSGEDCHQYAICTSGKLSVHMCPTGMAFSPSVYACMPEKEVDCEEARLTPESLFELAIRLRYLVTFLTNDRAADTSIDARMDIGMIFNARATSYLMRESDHVFHLVLTPALEFRRQIGLPRKLPGKSNS